MVSVITFFVLTLCVSPTFPLFNEYRDVPEAGREQFMSINEAFASAAQGGGNDLSSTMAFHREVQDQSLFIHNTYGNTSNHYGHIDLGDYQASGWALYEIVMDIQNITAAPEREVVGTSSTPGSTGLRIYEHDTLSSLYYDQLGQAFYNKSHDGRLANFSLLYISPRYSSAPSPYDYAYFELRSSYSGSSMIPGQQVDHVGLTPTWANITASVNLSANTVYWAVINGSLLVEYTNLYPDIRWYYETATGVFETRRHNTDGDTWGSDLPSREAFLNYTYTPWNLSANEAHVYSDPGEVAILANSSAMQGDSWVFNSLSNLSWIDFSSNQSVYVNYDLTLRYKRDISSSTSWHVSESGSAVSWNVTSTLSYPSVGGVVERTLNATLPSDWTALGLYNSTYPSQEYDHFTQAGNVVTCTSLGDETWTIHCSAPNYVRELSTYDSSDDSPIGRKVSVLAVMDVNSTIESPSSVPASSGIANLTILHDGSRVHTEESIVTSGLSYHDWNIQSESSGNGLYSVQVYWSNGTEAGYLIEEKVVFYPTDLTTSVDTISSFTDSSFDVSVFFNDTFTPQPLNGTFASVTYSFDAVVNASMFDHSNGTWTQSVDTSGMSPGMYDLLVYAEGFAFQNQSAVIEVTLIHETQQLAINWSNDSNITYAENTELIVTYRRVGGANISDATVNVTLPSDFRTLTWDAASESYRVTFHGDDVPPGFGTHSLTIQAWSQGHQPQTDSSKSFTITREPTLLQVTWSNTDTITYLDQTVLSVEYLMSNTTAIPLATVNVTIDSYVWDLQWNSTSQAYEITFNGTDASTGIGTHNL
ncbi:MAG: hypothetical protein ACFE8Z_04575, partial [Candidatus Hermodarchaeota archaeon]